MVDWQWVLIVELWAHTLLLLPLKILLKPPSSSPWRSEPPISLSCPHYIYLFIDTHIHILPKAGFQSTDNRIFTVHMVRTYNTYINIDISIYKYVYSIHMARHAMSGVLWWVRWRSLFLLKSLYVPVFSRFLYFYFSLHKSLKVIRNVWDPTFPRRYDSKLLQLSNTFYFEQQNLGIHRTHKNLLGGNVNADAEDWISKEHLAVVNQW